MRRHAQRIEVALSACAALLLVVMLSACAVSSSSAVHAVRVSPRTSLADQAVHIRVTGLAAGEQVTVRMSSTDVAGVHWLASAAYRADAAGTVDLNRAQAISAATAAPPAWA
jgi:Acyl-CoA thioester hydrolase/BAAT N-terminal region